MRILSITGPLHREFGGPPMAVTGAAVSLSNIGNQVKVIVCGQSFVDSQLNSNFFEKLSYLNIFVQCLVIAFCVKKACLIAGFFVSGFYLQNIGLDVHLLQKLNQSEYKI
jgi:ABC-type spermidine/putrescine transport system permease subunit I